VSGVRKFKAGKAAECSGRAYGFCAGLAGVPTFACGGLRPASVWNGRLHDGVTNGRQECLPHLLMSGEPTVIYSAANSQQAHLLKGLLEQEGISARVVNDAIQLAGGDLPVGWSAAARVVVAEQDGPAARLLAEEFDRQTAHEPTDDDQAEASELLPWSDWPVCPTCGERRSARCPVCGLSKTDFPLADIQELREGERVFLACDACDDHFLPEWFRVCPRCGYDYGDGIEISPPATARPVNEPRLAVVIGVLLAVGIIATAYFLWLFGWRLG
jgi:hypothetical protein